ncbi:MAG: hypothetical protein MI784_17605, partial [Cytophagales bacterium]|nr:hypothetical protein [Cytophagales bacterium]
RRSAREMEIFLSYVYQAPCSETSHKKVVPCVAFRGFGEIKSPEACLVLPKEYSHPELYPQATAGIRLSKVHKLLDDISAPPEKEPRSVGERKFKGRVFLIGEQETGRFDRGASLNARYVVDQAEEVCSKIQEVHGLQVSEAFKGFLSLAVIYLIEGYRGSPTYPKSMAVLLARTDFARMFSLLPENERRLLAKNDAASWLAVVRSMVPECLKDFSQPFFKNGVYIARPEIHRHILRGLSLEQWLKEMTKGRDLLTERHFPNRLRAYELESMGAMGDRTDTVLGEPAPIFEFRAGKKLMNAMEAMTYAVETFKTVYAVNRGLDHYYGEPLDIQ